MGAAAAGGRSRRLDRRQRRGARQASGGLNRRRSRRITGPGKEELCLETDRCLRLPTATRSAWCRSRRATDWSATSSTCAARPSPRAARCCSSTVRACERTSSGRRSSGPSSTSWSMRGYDVWLENWRASIDLAPNEWTLDQAAVHDHPDAVRKVVEETGADELKAVIHCQGSTSFMMSAVAGLVPEVKTIVTNAVIAAPGGPAALALQAAKRRAARRPADAVPRTRSGDCRAPTATREDARADGAHHPPRVRQRGLQAWSASPTARASRRCGGTRTSTRPRTSG